MVIGLIQSLDTNFSLDMHVVLESRDIRTTSIWDSDSDIRTPSHSQKYYIGLSINVGLIIVPRPLQISSYLKKTIRPMCCAFTC